MELCAIITWMIPRRRLNEVAQLLSEFPAVALTGPRQVGKTTLALEIADGRPSLYLDLESAEDRERVADPENYLPAHEDRLVILDEVQRFPGLFQSLRGLIDRGRRKGLESGRFLLLGSASMDLLRQSGESLAGRVAYVDLDPIDVLEVPEEDHQRLWLRGGFPRSFTAPDGAQSLRQRQHFVRTYLERDRPDLGPRVPAEALRRLWTMLCYQQGSTFDAAMIARNLGVDGKTVARYVDILVDLLLVRRLQPWHSNATKRMVRSPKLYVRDSGIMHSLLRLRDREDLLGHPSVGHSWEGHVIENVLRIAGDVALPSFYRTSNGAEIDLVLEWPGGEVWAIEVKLGLAPKPERGLYEGLADVKPDRSYVVYSGTDNYTLRNGARVIGVAELCREVLEMARGC